jgi:hypothetical protein
MLPEWQREAVKRELAELTRARGGQSALAEKLGISQAAISKVVVRGDVGPAVAAALLAHVGFSFEELAKKWGVVPSPAEGHPMLRTRAGWAAARDRAIADHEEIPREFFEMAGDTIPAGGGGDVLDPISIAALAGMYFRASKKAPASTSRARSDVEERGPSSAQAKR